MLIDTHSHLYASQFDEDRDQEVANCLEAGIQKILLPNIDKKSIDGMHQLVDKYPGVCYPMMGVHPCHILTDVWEEELSIAKKYLFEKTRDYIAVGEIGIDLHWDKTTLEIQQKAFRKQIKWAKELKLPIVIHARESFDEIFEIVDELNDDDLSGVFHCFTGTKQQAEKIIGYGGFKLGIGGVVTFKNSGVDKAIEGIDLSHFILETDAPYLAPTPYRGKRNQSSYLTLVAGKMVDIFGVSFEEIAKITSANAKELFKL